MKNKENNKLWQMIHYMNNKANYMYKLNEERKTSFSDDNPKYIQKAKEFLEIESYLRELYQYRKAKLIELDQVKEYMCRCCGFEECHKDTCEILKNADKIPQFSPPGDKL